MLATIEKKPVVAPVEHPAVALANTMLKTIDSLSDIMGREIDMVTNRAYDGYGEVLRQKQQLTVEYRTGMKTLATQPDLFKALPNALRTALKTAAQKLAEITERNGRLLRGAVVATQNLVKTFVELVREEVVVKPGYSNAHAGSMQPGNYDAVYKPVIVNRTA